MPNIDVNGQTIDYPDIGDPNWGDNATNFAIQTSSAFGKLGLDSGTSVDIPQTLDVTGNTTLDANLSVAGIVNIDSGVLYVDPVNNRVGINDTTPSQALDVTGEIQSSSHITCNGVVYADDDTTANTPVISFIGDTNTGIGRSASDTLDFITNGNSRFRIESTGQLQAVVSGNTTLYPGYLCRAWVNFNGTGTTGQNQTIRGSGNISSVLKNATGDYTVNIDVDMPDAYYATYITGRNQWSAAGNNITLGYYSTDSINTSQYNSGSVRITGKVSGATGWIDLDYISVGIFR